MRLRLHLVKCQTYMPDTTTFFPNLRIRATSAGHATAEPGAQFNRSPLSGEK